MSPRLEEALNHIGPARSTFIDHLRGGTSADYLSDWMKRAGFSISATTLKSARKELLG